MRPYFTFLLFFQTILLFSQEKQANQPLPQKTIELSEVIVRNESLYNIYKKAAYNLKTRLIKNKEIIYKIEGKESENISGEERALDILFSAKLGKVTPSKDKIDYKLMLSYLKHTPDVMESEIMKRSRYCVPLFFDNIPSEIKKNELNTFESDDSLIYIYDKNDEQDAIILYTICREDTTLIGINIDYKAGKRSSRPTSKTERLSGKIMVKYNKSDDGYYLLDYKISGSRYFKFRRTKKEEEVYLNYQVKAVPDTIVATHTEFKASTYKIYKMPNTEER